MRQLMLFILCSIGLHVALVNARSFRHGHETDSIAHLQATLKHQPKLSHTSRHSSLSEAWNLEAAGQPVGVTETKSQGWLDRMKDAFVSVVIGWILIIFSIPTMWINERRAAKMESLISVGKSECETVTGKKADEANRGQLVHINDSDTRAVTPVEATHFKHKLEGCVRLNTSVEVYQWVEHTKTTERDKLGGGKETITEYTYTTQWSSSPTDSGTFKQQGGHHNKCPRGLFIGMHTDNCERVEYGGGFVFPLDLIEGLNNFQNAMAKFGTSVTSSAGQAFQADATGGTYFYFREGGGWTASNIEGRPQVGDCRAAFRWVPEGPATVLALQVKQLEEEQRDTFMPYRLISRPICGSLSKEDASDRRLKQAKKKKQELADEDKVGVVCCLPCDLCTSFFAETMAVQIFNVWDGNQDAYDCWKDIQSSTQLLKWIFRFVGWLMMFIGLYLTFQPIITLLAVIPFLKMVGAWAIWILCFMVTAVASVFIICLAYLRYHPLTALMYMAIGGAIAALPNIIAAMH